MQVSEKIPTDSKVLVACQKGLRQAASLALHDSAWPFSCFTYGLLILLAALSQWRAALQKPSTAAGDFQSCHPSSLHLVKTAELRLCWGCRSLAATELLAKAGYSQLAWINGGFETSKQRELPVPPL